MSEMNVMSNQDSYVSVTVPWQATDSVGSNVRALAVRATAPRLLDGRCAPTCTHPQRQRWGVTEAIVRPGGPRPADRAVEGCP
jgi:hypothetical protein